MSKIDQKEYLKRYLCSDEKLEKKKKKKSKDKHAKIAKKTVKIIDDTATAFSNDFEEVDEGDLYATNEEAPQIVGIVDERAPSIIMKQEYQESGKWKSLESGRSKEKREKHNVDDNIRSNSKSLRRNSDESPPRRHRNEAESPPRKNRRNSDESPPRRRKNEHNESPPRKNRRNSDESPPRRRKNEPDQSPPRKARRNSDESPPRRRRNEPDQSPSRKTRRNSDESPPRRRRNEPDKSPPRKARRNSDESPPRRRRNEPDQSPPRKARRNSDESPPRRRRNEPDQSPPRKNRRNLDESLPRRHRNNSDESPPRKPVIKQEPKDDYRGKSWNVRSSPPPRLLQSIKQERLSNSPQRSLDIKTEIKREHSGSPRPQKMTKTLDGKASGLQNAKSLREENERYRARQEKMFREMDVEKSGKNADVVIRDRRGRNKDFEYDMEKERKKMEVEEERKKEYDRWGKGLKQLEEIEKRRQEYLHEASKPLARSQDDKDLQDYLKDQERLDDPMLMYMRRKKAEENKAKGVVEKPKYKGDFPDNRFNIRPGYRWDGVDRSNGYEKKYFTMINSKKSLEEEAYRYSTEDM